MPMPTSLIPARFLTLVSHFVIVVNIFWSRKDNVEACLPLSYTHDQYQNRDKELIVALSVTFGMFLIELVGFLTGVSMFNSTQNLISIGTHASASIALLFFFLDNLPCYAYWWIFTFCSLVLVLINSNKSLMERMEERRAIIVHCSGSICLAFFVIVKWECWTYWYIFGFSSALPACTEIVLVIAVFGLKKKPL